MSENSYTNSAAGNAPNALMRHAGRCHCGAVCFAFWSEPIVRGLRCNCSICIRKGIIMSTRYFGPADFDLLAGAEALSAYRFGDHSVDHMFCSVCGVSPFNEVIALPSDYEGAARKGARRVNLGCIDGLDVLALPIDIVDGRSF